MQGVLRSSLPNTSERAKVSSSGTDGNTRKGNITSLINMVKGEAPREGLPPQEGRAFSSGLHPHCMTGTN